MTAVSAFVDVTLIDGNGGDPVRGATVVVKDGAFAEIHAGPVDLPEEVAKIDGAGKYLLPGYMNGNIHLLDGMTMMGAGGVEYLARYEGSFPRVIQEGAQLTLRNGVTTVFDTWDATEPILQARDEINRGDVVASRIFAAGNIVGMGGLFTADFNPAARQVISPTFANRLDALFEAGVGANLTLLKEADVRAAFRDYIAKGVDMVKVAVSDHITATIGQRTYLTFPEKWLRWMAEETHDAGLPFLSHTLSLHALEIAYDIGTDVMIHPTWTMNQLIPDELVEKIARDRVGVGVQPMSDGYAHTLLSHGNWWGLFNSPEHVANEIKFIEAGANLMIATDAGCTSHDVLADLGEALHADRPWTLGEDHFTWIKAQTQRGLSSMAAIQALTRNVAEAYDKLDSFGTIEAGKIADAVLLDADPLADTANLQSIVDVYKAGQRIDRDSLPAQALVTAPTGTPVPAP